VSAQSARQTHQMKSTALTDALWEARSPIAQPTWLPVSGHPPSQTEVEGTMAKEQHTPDTLEAIRRGLWMIKLINPDDGSVQKFVGSYKQAEAAMNAARVKGQRYIVVRHGPRGTSSTTYV